MLHFEKNTAEEFSRRHLKIEPPCAKLTSQPRPKIEECEPLSFQSHLEQPCAKLTIHFSMFRRMAVLEFCPFNAERPALSQNIFFQKVHGLLPSRSALKKQISATAFARQALQRCFVSFARGGSIFRCLWGTIFCEFLF